MIGMIILVAQKQFSWSLETVITLPYRRKTMVEYSNKKRRLADDRSLLEYVGVMRLVG